MFKFEKYLHLVKSVMFDEAHHITAKKSTPFIEQIQKYCHSYYFTATPKNNKFIDMYEDDS